MTPRIHLRNNGGRPSASTVQNWFRDVVGRDLQIPSLDACDILGREFQKISNKANNDDLVRIAEDEGRVVDLLNSGLKDITLREFESIKFRRFTKAVHVLRREISSLSCDNRDHLWYCPTRGENGYISAAEISDLLSFIDIISPPPEAHRGRGRPVEAWHAPAKAIARLIVDAFRNCGYTDGLKPDDQYSHVAFVGAAAINWMFELRLEIEAEGFAAALKHRDRSATSRGPQSFEDRYPSAARVRKL